MINPDGKFLIMHRNKHPKFGDDPDIPGGSSEGAEMPLQTMLRKVREESGVVIDAHDTREIYSGAEYSADNTHYVLFIANLKSYPKIALSQEHSSYAWVDRCEFLQKAKSAKDTYMHMVHDTIKHATS